MVTAAATPAAAPAIKAVQAEQLPAPNSDFYQLVDVLSAEEKAIVKQVRTYMETEVQPVINTSGANAALTIRCAVSSRFRPNSS